MASNSNTQEVAAAPRFLTANLSPREMVDQTLKLSEVMKGNPALASQPRLSQAVDAWVSAAHELDKDAQDLVAARAAVAAKIATRDKHTLAWKRATKTVLAAVSEVTEGSPTAVKEWGFDVVTRVPVAHTTDAPTGLRATYKKDLSLVVRWDAVRGNRGYLVQLGEGAPLAWGASIPCPRALFVPNSLAPGREVSVRVAVQRKGGISLWSDALVITVR